MSKSPYSKEVRKLYEAGYSPLPIASKSKKAFVKDWTSLCNERATPEQLRKWSKIPNLNIGVTLGPASKIIALDFDEDVDGLHSKIQELIPSSPVVKVGGRGYTAFYYYEGEVNRKWKKDGKTILELLSSGRQTVLPPSIHPDGLTYKYDSLDELSEVKQEDLPRLPKDFVQKVDALFGIEDKKEYKLDATIEEVEDALSYISSDDYESWLQIGMAIHSAFSGEDGFELWDKWSSTSDKYNVNEMEKKWKSFRAGKISIGTLFYYATQEGYRCRFTDEELQRDTMQHFITLDQIEDTIDQWKREGRPEGTACGIDSLDKLLKFRKGEVTVISGYGNAGKSELLDSISLGLMKSDDKWKFAICSMEKGIYSHYDGLIHKYIGKSRKEATVEEYREAKSFLRNHAIMVDYNSIYYDFDNIMLQIERYMKYNVIDGIVIDPFNYLTTKYQGNMPLNHCRHILIGLSIFAKKHNVGIFLVAHPTKPDRTFGSLPKITKYSISGGADFVNIPDNIILVTRRGFTNIAQVEVAKVRDQETDKIDSFDLMYDKDSRSYEYYDDLDIDAKSEF